MSKKYAQDPLIKDILDDLELRFPGQIIKVFGIGSYFEEYLNKFLDDLPKNQ